MLDVSAMTQVLDDTDLGGAQKRMGKMMGGGGVASSKSMGAWATGGRLHGRHGRHAAGMGGITARRNRPAGGMGGQRRATKSSLARQPSTTNSAEARGDR